MSQIELELRLGQVRSSLKEFSLILDSSSMNSLKSDRAWFALRGIKLEFGYCTKIELSSTCYRSKTKID